MRKYSLNDKYFETWSHSMAYILGFISADGSVDKYSLSIEINKKDKEVLDFIRNELQSTNPIHLSKDIYLRLRINSLYLVRTLMNLGVVPNKTHIIRLPDIPNEFFWSYLLGLFDGDGCVLTRRNTLEMSIASGSHHHLKDISDKINLPGSLRIRNNGSWSCLDYRKESSILIRDKMYKNAPFFLSRKKDIFYSNFYIPSEKLWTLEQIQILKDNYGKVSLDKLATLVKKTYKATSIKVGREKLTKKKP